MDSVSLSVDSMRVKVNYALLETTDPGVTELPESNTGELQGVVESQSGQLVNVLVLHVTQGEAAWKKVTARTEPGVVLSTGTDVSLWVNQAGQLIVTGGSRA